MRITNKERLQMAIISLQDAMLDMDKWVPASSWGAGYKEEAERHLSAALDALREYESEEASQLNA